MTLILNLLTNDYAIQVSDRRPTRPDGSVVTDERNKCRECELSGGPTLPSPIQTDTLARPLQIKAP